MFLQEYGHEGTKDNDGNIILTRYNKLLSYTPATTSISTNAPFGKVFTATADLAGYGSVKNSAFISAKSFISAMNTVVFTTLPIVRPASSRIAFTLSNDWRVCSLIPPSTNTPVAGSMGI